MTNEHLHPTIKAVLDQFDPLAMSDRFKAATEPTESTPQLRAITHLIEQAIAKATLPESSHTKP